VGGKSGEFRRERGDNPTSEAVGIGLGVHKKEKESLGRIFHEGKVAQELKPNGKGQYAQAGRGGY